MTQGGRGGGGSYVHNISDDSIFVLRLCVDGPGLLDTGLGIRRLISYTPHIIIPRCYEKMSNSESYIALRRPDTRLRSALKLINHCPPGSGSCDIA